MTNSTKATPRRRTRGEDQKEVDALVKELWKTFDCIAVPNPLRKPLSEWTGDECIKFGESFIALGKKRIAESHGSSK